MIKKKIYLLLAFMIFNFNDFAVASESLSSTLTNSLTNNTNSQASTNVLYGGKDLAQSSAVIIMQQNFAIMHG